MKIMTAFRNLDSHGQHRGPEVIEEEAKKISDRVTRFPPDLVHLEASVSQTRGKTRIRASLRLQLPSGVIAAQEEGYVIEPVLRKAFADLLRRLNRHLARLTHEPEWKRPQRRAKLGKLLPTASTQAEADRRALYFDLVDDHLDDLYNYVRRELTYLENSGAVPFGGLGPEELVDAVVIAGLEQFDTRPERLSMADWLRKLAIQTVDKEAKRLSGTLPENVEILEEEPEVPAEEPTESDQEMFEFYQPDDVLLLEDIIADEETVDLEGRVASHERQMAVQRALSDLPPLWRNVLYCLHTDEVTDEEAADILELDDEELLRIEKEALDSLRSRLSEVWKTPLDTSKHAGSALKKELAQVSHIPMPLRHRERLTDGLKPQFKAKTPLEV